MDTYRYLFSLIILILLSGLFSASETALTSFRSIHLEEIAEKYPKKGELLKYWLKKPNEMLTALLLGNNVVNILATSLATALITNVLQHKGNGNSQNMSVFISTTVMTIVILIFGEITPKIIAKNNSMSISNKVITPIYYLAKITYPIIFILTGISKFIGRVIGINIKDEAIMITEQDILSYVNVGEAEGVIEVEEKDMIESVVTFGETTAKEVMTPRTSVYAIEGNKSIDDVWNDIVTLGYSRIPVYNEVMDEIIGILYVKDLLNAVKEGKSNMPVKNFIRKAYFVPETKTIMKILEDFKTQKVHMAIVIDEYGGTVGVITIEDVIEEIFGEIRDEYDKEDEEVIKEKEPNVYEVNAMLDIETINKELDIELPESEDYESLGGLIVNELDNIAKVGDVVKIDNVELKVLETSKRRVSKVLIKKENGDNECEKD